MQNSYWGKSLKDFNQLCKQKNELKYKELREQDVINLQSRFHLKDHDIQRLLVWFINNDIFNENAERIFNHYAVIYYKNMGEIKITDKTFADEYINLELLNKTSIQKFTTVLELLKHINPDYTPEKNWYYLELKKQNEFKKRKTKPQENSNLKLLGVSGKYSESAKRAVQKVLENKK